ncbi:MAG: penicillin-binding protein 2 [Candidatus Sungbacteria bacterium]|nr:penicillin-binding protein 2 [Candidatus Sungbacteria bacterium]
MAYLKNYQTLRFRLLLLLVFFIIAFGVLVGRVFRLAIVQHRTFVEAAEKQHVFSQTLLPERGRIFFQDKAGTFHPAALNRNTISLVASPRDIEGHDELIPLFSKQFSIEPAVLESKIRQKDDTYEIIAKDISDEDVQFIQSLGFPGFSFERESRRVYPNNELGAGIIGFVNYDGGKETGVYGIERQFQDKLSGEDGFFEGERGWVAIGKRILNPPVNGSSLVLTIDRNIQFSLEETLSKMLEKWGGESAHGVILEPSTGRILALGSVPTFDPNEFSKVKDYSVFRTPVVDSQFELGSVFKPITMAAALEEGLVTPLTTYNDTGAVVFGKSVIKNFDGKAYKIQTMTQVLEKSLNTGAIWVEKLTGHKRFLEYIERFGFGSNSGIDFPNEVPGNIGNLESGRDLEFATASFGQGIAVTPLQMATAFAAIANGGALMKPYVLEKIIDDSGNETIFSSEKRRDVVSTSTSEALTKMLVSAVRNGFENKAGVKGYFVAGKTGTAQIPAKDRRGYSDEVIHTFIGYAPAFRPKFLILLQLNKPGGNRFAANTLTPAFHDLAEFILNYYEIPPDEK